VSLSAAGGTGAFFFNRQVYCPYTTTSNAAWITITGGAQGSGSGYVFYSVAANTGPPRTGTVSVGGKTFTVYQGSNCSYTIAPNSSPVGAAGGGGNISVTTSPGCTWEAVSQNPSFIIVTSGASGSGSGTVNYTGAARNGTITVAGQTFTVQQSGNPNSDTDGDGMPDVIEAQEGRNPLVKDNDIFQNARWFA
jgi:hypothetical protein